MSLGIRLQIRQTRTCSVCDQEHDYTRELPITCRPRMLPSGKESSNMVLALGHCPVCYMPVRDERLEEVARRAEEFWKEQNV